MRQILMKSISKKMTFFTVMLVVISLLVATFASVAIIYTTTKSLTEQTLTETATVAADKVSWELKAIQNIAIQAGCNPKLSSVIYTNSQKQREIDTIVASFGLDRGASIDYEGHGSNGVNYDDRDYFKAAMEGRTTITEPIIGRSNGKLSVIIAAPLWENGELNSKVVGCIYFVPNEEFLNDIVRRLKINENGAAYIIDKKLEKGKKVNRKSITVIMATVIFIVGLPTALDGLGTNVAGGALIDNPAITFGLPTVGATADWLDFYDMIAEGILMPLGSLAMSIIIGWVFGNRMVKEEVACSGHVYRAEGFYNICFKYIVPVIMVIVLYAQIQTFFG